MPAHKIKLTEPSSFDKYAHEYDQLTNASAREKYHSKEVQSLIDDFAPSFVIDAGCGAGLTSMLLAKTGVKTVGLDRETKMIATSRKKYDKLNFPLKFMRGSFEAPPKSLSGKADLLICLANGVSGLGTVANLKRGLKGFYRCLKPGGVVLIQMLNYGSIPEGRIMPIRATEADGIIYLRYARRIGRRYSLHIVRVDNSKQPPTFEPFCHDFDNFSPTELVRTARQVGFERLGRFADIERKRKFDRSARDLVLVGRKPQR